MAELKTKKTEASVTKFIDAVSDPKRREECRTILGLMKAVTREEPRMWGASIVGFGSYRYKYESGREGEWLLTGFSPRKQNLTLYLMDGVESHPELAGRLGKFTTGRSCLYLKRLEDVDLTVLKKLVAASVKGVKARFK